MKKQFKALALVLAILATTGCGSDQAKVSKETKAGQAEVVQTKETKVANVSTPKSGAIKVEEKDNRNYLIPQTLELKEQDKKEDNKKEDNKKEEVVEEIEDEANKEVVLAKETAIQQVPQEEVEQAIEQEVQQAPQEEIEQAIEQEVQQAPQEEIEQTIEQEVQEEIEQPIEEVEEQIELAEAATYENAVVSAPAAKKEVAVASPKEEDVEENIVEADNVSNGLTITSPSAEEVKAYWSNYESKATDTIDYYGLNLINPESKEAFASMPNADLNKFNLGAVSNTAQEDALHIVNTARFASGIKNELTVGKKQAQFAQAASMVNRLNLQVDHFPGLPAGANSDLVKYDNATIGAANSNLSSGFNLLDSVLEYLKDDLGDENQAEVGHRRWVLNPQVSQVGLGQADEFNAMFVNNDNYAGENANTVYAYPGETAISEFYSEGSSLSLMFGENFDLTNAQVEVKDLETGEVSKESHVDENFKGNVKAITFGYGMNYQAGTKLQVKVTGVTKNGQDYPVEYTINYMSIR